MTRSFTTLTVLAAALLASACSSFEERREASLPAQQRHPIEVSTQVEALDVQTDTRGGLTGRSRTEVSSFLRAFKQEGAGVLEIHVASPNYDVAEAEVRDLASIQGVPRNAVVLRSFVPAPGTRTQVRLAFARYVASVPTCSSDNWGENLGLTWDNTPYNTFGCATQVNAAAQIADPRDVLEAREMTPRSAARRTDVMQKYQTGKKTMSEGSDSKEDSAVSDVAK